MQTVHRHLTYSSSSSDDDIPADEIPSPDSTPQLQHHIDVFQQPSSKYTLNTYVNLEEEEEEEEEDFQTVPPDDEHWDMEEFLIDIYVSMNIHCHMDYAHTHVHIWITKSHHSMIPWI